MDCFRVRCFMGSVVVLSGHPLHLDGLLAALMAPTPDPEASRYVDPGLPLARAGTPDCYYYCASAWEIPVGDVWPGGYVRTSSWLEWAGEYVSGRPVEQQRGPYRRYLEQVDLLAAPEVLFYARGDAQQVARVLGRALEEGRLSLGPMRRVGYGQVVGVKVEPVSADWSVVGPDGWVARYVPVGLAPAGARGLPGRVPCRPPYWYMPRAVECLCPSPARWLPQLRPGSGGGGVA